MKIIFIGIFEVFIIAILAVLLYRLTLSILEKRKGGGKDDRK